MRISFFFVGLAPLIVNRYMKCISDKLLESAVKPEETSGIIVSGQLGLTAKYLKRLCEILGGTI
jgi:hypothetical protein